MIDSYGNIVSFSGEHRFLSNFFWPCIITLDGNHYPSVEHAYQASKTHDLNERMEICRAYTPGAAKRLGQTVTKRGDWEIVKITIMRNLVGQKFDKPELHKLLHGTGLVMLVEGNYWHDNFWGACRCKHCRGKEKRNELGKILMDKRHEH